MLKAMRKEKPATASALSRIDWPNELCYPPPLVYANFFRHRHALRNNADELFIDTLWPRCKEAAKIFEALRLRFRKIHKVVVSMRVVFAQAPARVAKELRHSDGENMPYRNGIVIQITHWHSRVAANYLGWVLKVRDIMGP